jgi:polar amino acid transport system substrate-binding protein
LQETGALRVGLDASYPPFEYVDAANQIVGFDVDLASELGRRMGVEMVFINIAYDGLYDSLLIGQVDILISALVATREYEGKAAFSVPYFNAGEYLVVHEGSSIHSMADLTGSTLAVEYGSGGDVEARRWERRLAGLGVARFPDSASALQAVVNGEADAALVDGITARLGVGQHPELALGDNIVETLIAAAVHPDSTTLKGRIDEVLSEMIYDGTVGALVEKWFGPQRGG